MGNKKKLKSKDGATRIVPMAGGDGSLYGIQYYDAVENSWEDVEGLHSLTWEEAQTGRRNYVAARNAVKDINRLKIHASIGN